MSIDELRPGDTPAYITPMWLACMSWAIGVPEIVDQFRAETGNNWRPGRSGIEHAIDAATGADRHFIEAFIKWANVNVWGPIDGPDKEGASA